MQRYLLTASFCLALAAPAHGQALPGTKPLEMQGDLAKQMVEGIDRYLMRELAASVEKRKDYWKPDYTSPSAYKESILSNRERLQQILGVIDLRTGKSIDLDIFAGKSDMMFDFLAKGRPFLRANETRKMRESLMQFAQSKGIINGQITRGQFAHYLEAIKAQRPPSIALISDADSPPLVGEGKDYKIFAVRWNVLPGVDGEGLLLEPNGKPKACVVAIPDADQTPEMIAGLVSGLSSEKQFARILAESGSRVVVPTLINRQDTLSGNSKISRFTNQTHREFVYRMSYEMGRHVIGYEIQKILGAVDWFAKEKEHPPIGVYGYGEGGLLALYSAALDPRIDSTVVSGYFGPREELHDEPIYRNVWSLLKEFGDGELIRLIVPRSLTIEQTSFSSGQPPAARAGRAGAAPGMFTAPPLKATMAEFNRILQTLPPPDKFPRKPVQLAAANEGKKPTAVRDFLKELTNDAPPDNDLAPPKALKLHDPETRQKRQFDQLVDYTQKLMPDAVSRRQEFVWNKLDTSSIDKFKKSQEPLRDYFWENIIGKLPEPNVPINPRTRLHHETPKYKAYEVVLDVYEDVFSFGILCVPNDLKPGEKRPVVVCQHGLEGRPSDVVNPKTKTPYYNSFGTQLAEQGFVVFAPQNPYIFKNEFRQLVRKANPLQLSLYAFIVRQHQRILEWLSSLPFVDPARIAYYGLSYGGKVAMRIPAILTQYCLSICSGDFNEWIWKNITLDWGSSYMFTPEYEMYEFDLGNTFNYAEMAALIAPRPFMVERGHNDGVGLDEYVAFEYAKVRRLYARLGIADRTEIEFFSGGHECRVVGTLAFLRKHLNWPER